MARRVKGRVVRKDTNDSESDIASSGKESIMDRKRYVLLLCNGILYCISMTNTDRRNWELNLTTTICPRRMSNWTKTLNLAPK